MSVYIRYVHAQLFSIFMHLFVCVSTCMCLVEVSVSHRALVEVREPQELLFTFYPA